MFFYIKFYFRITKAKIIDLEYVFFKVMDKQDVQFASTLVSYSLYQRKAHHNSVILFRSGIYELLIYFFLDLTVYIQ